MSWFICLFKNHFWMTPAKDDYQHMGRKCARCGQWEYEP